MKAGALPSQPPAAKFDLSLPEVIREGLGFCSGPEPVMGDKIIPLPNEDAERIRAMTMRMANGDETAFKEFYECYCDRLFRYLLLLTRGNEDLARDLLQITMTKVVRGQREFRDEAQLWNWLAAIARNNFIDSLRRIQRAPQLVPLLPDDAPGTPLVPADESDTPLFDALDRCLIELEADEQALIEAVYFKRGSHNSVAEQQNTTPKAVESKLARLRQKLRTAILKRLRYEND
jgi:RNA polymerase sigma-70 factor (ECF subfamily)